MKRIQRIRRSVTVLAGLAGALLALAWAAAVPAASASIIPFPGDGPYGPAPAPAIQVITAGGMPGWQITLIAIGAALLAATVAVLLDRARAVRRNSLTADA